MISAASSAAVESLGGSAAHIARDDGRGGEIIRDTLGARVYIQLYV